MITDLSIIIVNWNSVEYLRRCLGSIFSTGTGLDFEVLVVDNGSYDGCAEMLRQHFPQVRSLQSPNNLGFAAACNLAFAFSTGRNLLFLNPDTEIVGDALHLMLEALACTPDAGIVGPRLVGRNLRPQWNCMRRVPTILNQFLDSAFSRRALPRYWGFDVVARQAHDPVAAQVVPGTCLMVRREIFAKAGFFKRAYFMYAEDVDLCCQARKLGWKTYYLHDAVVVHHGAASSRVQQDSAFSAVLMRKSVWKFLSATRGWVYAAAYRATTALAAVCRMAAGSGLWLFAGRERRPLWRASAHKWSRVLLWSLGRERWVRELSTSSEAAALPAELQPATAIRQKLSA